MTDQNLDIRMVTLKRYNMNNFKCDDRDEEVYEDGYFGR
ncbi:hypothetical protein MYOV085v1_p0054 [Vibrio phage 355E48.1]|nr:hypothetical protein MYOV085v1_p0054 [Vibrio phage 355E48.1]